MLARKQTSPALERNVLKTSITQDFHINQYFFLKKYLNSKANFAFGLIVLLKGNYNTSSGTVRVSIVLYDVNTDSHINIYGTLRLKTQAYF